MPNHTPGPWRIDPNPELPLAVIQDNEAGLGICEGLGGSPESWANARLIAAAPELLEALRECIFAFRELAENAGDIPEWNTGGVGYEASRSARAILAKLEG